MSAVNDLLPRTASTTGGNHLPMAASRRSAVSPGVQLLAEGWMHNRVRMIVASFLVKDLHIEWTWGARHFMRRLVDADLASNQHGWQWTAGPDGTYIRRWVPELDGLRGREVHEPWRRAGASRPVTRSGSWTIHANGPRRWPATTPCAAASGPDRARARPGRYRWSAGT